MSQLLFKKIFNIFLLLLFTAPVFCFSGKANALGFAITEPQLQRANFQMAGYWDLRDRQTYFQVTNRSGEEARVHIQVFNVGDDCAEFDYYDTFTPFDTHVYNIRELDRNNDVTLSAPDLSGGHGIIAVTLVNPDDSLRFEQVLKGNFKVLDAAGYEYRSNFAGTGVEPINVDAVIHKVNFNDVADSNHSDIVVISFLTTSEPGGIIPVEKEYNVILYDENENPISCSSVVLGCPFDQFQPGGLINTGINQAVTNSREGPSLCLGTDRTGIVQLLDTDGFGQFLTPETTVVFVGLNNNNGSGSMSVAIQEAEIFEIEDPFPDICEMFPELCEQPRLP